MFKIGSIGAGHMGMAILDAMSTTAREETASILVYELDPERRRAAKARGFIAAGNESEVYLNSQILLMAVRPQHCEGLLKKLSASAKRRTSPTIINIMAGISSDFIRRHLGSDTHVITVMPTMGMKTGHGMAALSHTNHVPKDILSYITKIFTATGEAIVVDEPLLKDIVAVSGCMPGYVFYLIDAFAKGAKGVDYQTAARMAARGFIGAATQVLGGSGPAELLSQVATPDGLTAQGIASFEQSKIAEMLAEGMEESVRRGYELAK